MLTMKKSASKPAIRIGLEKIPIVRSFAEIFLNIDMVRDASSKDKIRAIKVKIIDSPKNCLISWGLSAPTTFLRPTSLALLAERAVARFIKFKQASKSIKRPIPEKR